MASMLDRPSAIGTMVAAMVVGAMFFLLMPMYIGALSDYAGFSNQQIGNLTFFELSGVALVSLSSLFWIRRIDWRVVYGVSCVTLVFSNALSTLDHEFYWLVGTRILAGMGEGGLLCIGYAALGDTKEVDRNFGFSVIGQILAPALFFVMLPGWFSEYGLSAIFSVQLVCALLAILLVPLFPPVGLEHDNKISIFRIGRFPLLGLFGLVLFYIGVTAVWGFLERMGVEEGFGAQEIANILAISLIASVFGAVLASIIGVRFTRHWPMVVALAVQLFALIILVDGMSFMTYALAMIFYSLGVNWHSILTHIGV
jgi:MFS family permease